MNATASPGAGDWLIISYEANVNGSACSHHLDDRLPYLREAGVNATVVSSIRGPRLQGTRHTRVAGIGPSLLRQQMRDYFKARMGRHPLRGVVQTLALLPILPFYLLESLLIRWDPTWWWALSGMVVGGWHLLRGRAGLIYSTGGHNSAHVAGLALSRAFKVTWIAELQDPLIFSYCSKSKAEHRMILWLEKAIFKHAGGVIFLTRAAAEVARERTGIQRACTVIVPGARLETSEPAARAASAAEVAGRELDRKHLRFVHAGSMSGPRSPEPFLKGLAHCLRENPGMAETVRVDFYGTLAPDYARAVREFPCPGVAALHGKVSREQALEKMRSAGVLLLVQGEDPVSLETIPSKAYEYLHLGRPILGLVHQNRELREMLIELGHKAVEVTDLEAIRGAILELHERWLRNALPPAAESPYTISAAVKQLLDCAERVRRAK